MYWQSTFVLLCMENIDIKTLIAKIFFSNLVYYIINCISGGRGLHSIICGDFEVEFIRMALDHAWLYWCIHYWSSPTNVCVYFC